MFENVKAELLGLLKRVWPNASLLVHLMLATLMSVPQVKKMEASTQGVDFMMFIGAWLGFALALSLAFRGHAVQPSRATTQQLKVYGLWTVIWGMLTVKALTHLVADVSHWGKTDTANLLAIIIGLGGIFLFSRFRKMDMKDPLFSGLVATAFRIAPFGLGSIKIWQEGIGGISFWFIIVGWGSVGLRIVQNWLVYNELRSDKSRWAIFLPEVLSFPPLLAIGIAYAKWSIF